MPDVPLEPSLPLVPDVPLEPFIPDVPLEPFIPLVPDVPDVPLVPLDPLVPLVPLVPLDPLLPLVPDVPLVPLLPLVPAVPLVPAELDAKGTPFIEKLPLRSKWLGIPVVPIKTLPINLCVSSLESPNSVDPVNSITEDSLEKVGYFKNALWHDQTCLTILYESKQDLKDNLKIISNRFLNHNEYNQGNFIFHAYAFGFISNRTLDIIYKNKVEARPKFDSINLIVYHVYCVNNYLEIVEKQLDRLKTSGLYDWCDKIELTCVNTEGIFEDIETLIKDLTKVNLNKFVSNNYEYEGIKKVWEYSQKYEGKVLYFHSKGVSNQYKNTKSQEKSEWKTKGVSWWKEAMEYFLIDSYKDCLQVLDNYDQCGLTINNGWWWGNFWWSNLSWIYSNPEPNNGDRWYFEAWLNRYRSPSYYEYYHFDFNPYYTILPNDLYYNNVKYKDANIELIEAFYGTLGEQQDEGRPLAERNVIDVTEQLKSNLEIHNFKGFHIRVDNNIAGDPCYGTEKALEVRFLLNGERCVIVTDENRNLNFSI